MEAILAMPEALQVPSYCNRCFYQWQVLFTDIFSSDINNTVDENSADESIYGNAKLPKRPLIPTSNCPGLAFSLPISTPKQVDQFSIQLTMDLQFLSSLNVSSLQKKCINLVSFSL
jgi:hypothetical protein